MNTYEDIFYFIAKCLTISVSKEKKSEISFILTNQKIDWDLFVKIASNELMLPALYTNLKKARFLDYLPSDLVKYFKYINEINHNRNKKLLKEVSFLNGILLGKKIKPIFIKGTGNLLGDLYHNISERMINDIDLLVSEENYFKTIDLLKENNYELVLKNENIFPNFRHFSRLKRKRDLISVEVHKELTTEYYSKGFNYDLVFKKICKKNGYYIFNNNEQKINTIISSQINDNMHFMKNVPLRNAYDFLLLTHKNDAIIRLKSFKKLNDIILSFKLVCNEIFGVSITSNDEISYSNRNFLRKYRFLKSNDFYRILDNKIKYFILFIFDRLLIIKKAFYRVEFRTWLFKRIFK